MSTTTTTSVDLETIKQTAENIAASVVYDNDGCLVQKHDDEYLHATQLRILDDGYYRTVTVQDGIVYKVLKNYSSTQNRREWQLYRNAPPVLRAIMAEALYLSKCGRVLAMERVASTLKDADPTGEKRATFNTHLEKILYNLGYANEKISEMMQDNHPANIGITFDGIVKWIDYASETAEDFP